MRNAILQIYGFALMVLGIQGVIRLLAGGDAGLLNWVRADTSVLIAVNVITALSGVALLSWADKKSKLQ